MIIPVVSRHRNFRLSLGECGETAEGSGRLMVLSRAVVQLEGRLGASRQVGRRVSKTLPLPDC